MGCWGPSPSYSALATTFGIKRYKNKPTRYEGILLGYINLTKTGDYVHHNEKQVSMTELYTASIAYTWKKCMIVTHRNVKAKVSNQGGRAGSGAMLRDGAMSTVVLSRLPDDHLAGSSSLLGHYN